MPKNQDFHVQLPPEAPPKILVGSKSAWVTSFYTLEVPLVFFLVILGHLPTQLFSPNSQHPILITIEKHLGYNLSAFANVPGHPRGLEGNKYG